MEKETVAPVTSSGRVLKSDTEKKRSLSEDRIKFVEEEYDFLCHELSAWLSGLVGKEVDDNLVESLQDGLVLCSVVKTCLPDIKIEKYHEDAEKGTFYAKDNIAIFARACQQMGISKNDCVTVTMFDEKNRKLIVNAILRFALVGIQYGLKPISLIHSELVEAMPEELAENIKAIQEEEKKEEGEKKEEKKEERDSAAKKDNMVICGLIIFMYTILIGMFYMAIHLMRDVNEAN